MLTLILPNIGTQVLANQYTQTKVNNYPNAINFVPVYPYSCANQTDESNVTYTIGITISTPTDLLKFNTSTLEVPTSACVKLIFHNAAPDLYHDFIIEEVGGGKPDVIDADLSGPNIDAIDMIIQNSTADIGFGPGNNVFYFYTPHVPSEFTYFCEQPGHRPAGEFGTLKVVSAKLMNFVPLVPFSCANQLDETNVSYQIAIIASDAQGTLKFNKASLYVPENACVKLTFQNNGAMTHDFVIDEVGGGNTSKIDADLSGPNIDTIKLSIGNSTSDIGFGPGLNVFYFYTPQVPAQFTFYCDIPGHRQGGEQGTLFVGTSSSSTTTISSSSTNTLNANSPGFDFIELFSIFICLTWIKFRFSRKKIN